MNEPEKVALTTQEKVELNKFLEQNARDIGIGGRKEMFTRNAINELLWLREENESRRQAGKEPLSKDDRYLTLKDGVVKSVARKKQEIARRNEAEISRIEGLMENMGNEF